MKYLPLVLIAVRVIACNGDKETTPKVIKFIHASSNGADTGTIQLNPYDNADTVFYLISTLAPYPGSRIEIVPSIATKTSGAREFKIESGFAEDKIRLQEDDSNFWISTKEGVVTDSVWNGLYYKANKVLVPDGFYADTAVYKDRYSTITEIRTFMNRKKFHTTVIYDEIGGRKNIETYFDTAYLINHIK